MGLRPVFRVPLIITASLALWYPLVASAAQSSVVLAPGAAIERELKAGETHSYRVWLQAGQYLNLVIDQGKDSHYIEAKIHGPDGRQSAEVTQNAGGEQRMFFIAETTGEYRVEVGFDRKDRLAGHYEIRVVELREASEEDKSRVLAQRLCAEAARLGPAEDAITERRTAAVEKYEAALEVWRKLRDPKAELDTLLALGEVNYFVDRQKALENFNQALAVAQAIGDRSSEVAILEDIGEALHGMGEEYKALDAFNQSLTQARALNDRSYESLDLYHIALIYKSLGEAQQALDYNQQLLKLSRPGDPPPALALHSLCQNYLLLGEPHNALSYCQEALSLWRAQGRKLFVAATNTYIGNAYGLLEDQQKELEYANRALEGFREAEDKQGEASVLNWIGHLSQLRGDHQKAIEYHQEAMSLYRGVPNLQGEAVSLRLLGQVYASLGDNAKGFEYLNAALAQWRALGDKGNEAAALLDIARLERDTGQLAQARRDIEAALGIVESLTARVNSLDLRASYLATKHEYYEFYIDLLMRVDSGRPGEGYAAQALEASERARARSLAASLIEAGVDIHQGVDRALIARERKIKQEISLKSKQLTGLMAARHTPEQAAAAQSEVDALVRDYREVEAEIRTTSPRYAALSQPAPASVKEIQTQILDDETALLEYALGKERSFLWAVTRQSIKSYELPSRSEIDRAARRVYDTLTARNRILPNETEAQQRLRIERADAEYPKAATALSEMILGPLGRELGTKRLLIVSEGALQYVPFGALPVPIGGNHPPAGESRASGDRHGTRDGYRPLIVEHEIVSLPSALVLSVLRRELIGRQQPSKSVAVLADPVFSLDDQRLGQLARSKKQLSKNTSVSDALRSAEESGLQDLVRLRFSRIEADAVAQFAPSDRRLEAIDFEASRDVATGPELRDYRTIHFATHGLINNVHPELSGIVLSLVDKQGREQDGFLRLYDIYNLKLNAGLVVLSACQTALGKEIKGEGLVGLTRGFMYAGAPRVVASLWRIDDRATAELMKRFYEAMLRRGLRPAAALRAAQVSMWKDQRWAKPHYWAGFTIQGEFK